MVFNNNAAAVLTQYNGSHKISRVRDMPRADKQREQQGTAPCAARPHACPYCPTAFGLKCNLTKHVSTVHESAGTTRALTAPRRSGRRAT